MNNKWNVESWAYAREVGGGKMNSRCTRFLVIFGPILQIFCKICPWIFIILVIWKKGLRSSPKMSQIFVAILEFPLSVQNYKMKRKSIRSWCRKKYVNSIWCNRLYVWCHSQNIQITVCIFVIFYVEQSKFGFYAFTMSKNGNMFGDLNFVRMITEFHRLLVRIAEHIVIQSFFNNEYVSKFTYLHHREKIHSEYESNVITRTMVNV